MFKTTGLGLMAMALAVGCAVAVDAAENPFVGRWALTIPGGGAGWLGVTQERGYMDASILWGGGSVVPVSSVFVWEDSLFINRTYPVQRRDEQGKVIATHMFTDTIIAKVSGDTMDLTLYSPNRNSQGVRQSEFTGKRIPDLPPKPDLSQLKFGEPIQLFNGKNLDGWVLTDPNQVNGWSVINGVLVNRPTQIPGYDHIPYGNLRTEKEFEDFNLKIDVNVPPGENSGIYLRGIYEVQVMDSYQKPLDSHNMGAIYSRITPSVNAEKPAGEWQTFDITLVNRHVTVVLNGVTIIDNQPLLGCTGGALWSDQFRPGPIYLQGDHGPVMYRNIVLTPIVK
ncbi:MAG TPA: DUF1080 domain-containing protein [bacterium]|nr:DUF1080 domain-containing protein [bacterium]